MRSHNTSFCVGFCYIFRKRGCVKSNISVLAILTNQYRQKECIPRFIKVSVVDIVRSIHLLCLRQSKQETLSRQPMRL